MNTIKRTNRTYFRIYAYDAAGNIAMIVETENTQQKRYWKKQFKKVIGVYGVRVEKIYQ